MPLWAVSILAQLTRAQGLLPRGLKVCAFACEELTINTQAMCTNLLQSIMDEQFAEQK